MLYTVMQVLEHLSEGSKNVAQGSINASKPPMNGSAPTGSTQQGNVDYSSQAQPSAADELYQQLVQLGLLRR